MVQAERTADAKVVTEVKDEVGEAVTEASGEAGRVRVL